jgi:hypothetical protein
MILPREISDLCGEYPYLRNSSHAFKHAANNTTNNGSIRSMPTGGVHAFRHKQLMNRCKSGRIDEAILLTALAVWKEALLAEREIT